MKKAFLALIIAGAFVAGSVFAGTSVAFAIQDKTLDSECAKQKHDSLLALLCDSVMNLEGETDNDTLGGLTSCTDGQVVKSTSGTWDCADDIDTDTDTIYTDADAVSAVGGNLIVYDLNDCDTRIDCEFNPDPSIENNRLDLTNHPILNDAYDNEATLIGVYGSTSSSHPKWFEFGGPVPNIFANCYLTELLSIDVVWVNCAGGWVDGSKVRFVFVAP
jgi:hypothetical protein